jgi:hypothetical protein
MGVLQDLREILTAHNIEKYNENPPFAIVSPELSHISEEKLSGTASAIHEGSMHQMSIISGSLDCHPISNVNENVLNIQKDIFNESSKQRKQMNKKKEVNVKCFESAPVASCCSKEGEDNYEPAGQRVNPIASHNADMTSYVHLSRTDRVENSSVKHKFPSNCRIKSLQTSCVTGGLKLRSSEPQQENVNLNSVLGTTEQQKVNETAFNKEALTMNHEPSTLISSVKDSIKPSVHRKDMFKQKCYETKDCITACSSKEDSTNSANKFKSSSMVIHCDKTESSESVNSGLGEGKTGSSIKMSLERRNKLLQKPQELAEDSSEDNAQFKEVKKVTGTEVALFERPKELLYKPEEMTDVSFSDSLQSNVRLQKVKNKKVTVKSVPESRSAAQEDRNVGSAEIILSHKTSEFLDRPPEQATLSDLKNNVHSYSDVIEIRQATVSTVTFTRLHKRTCGLGRELEASASKNKFSLISNSEESKLVSDCKANTNVEPRRLLCKSQKQDESLSIEKTAQKDSQIAEVQQTAKSNASFKRVSKRLDNKHVNSLDSENVLLNTSDSAKVRTKNTSDDKVKDFLHKRYKETDISTSKNNTQNDSDFIEDKQSASSKMIFSRLSRLRNKQQMEVSISEDCAVDKSDSVERLKLETRKHVAIRLKKICKKPQEQTESLETNTENNSGWSEHDTGESFRNTVEGLTRTRKQKKETGNCIVSNFDPLVKPIDARSSRVTKKSQEKIGVVKNGAQHNLTFAEDKKTAYSRIGETNIQQEELKDCAVNSDSLAKSRVDRLRLHSKPHDEFKVLKNNVQNESDIVKHKKTLRSKKIAEKSTEVHKKDVVDSCAVNKCASLAEPTTDESGTLCKKREEQIESLESNAQNESDFVANKKIASSKKRVKRSKRPYSKQQKEVIISSSNFDLLTKVTPGRLTKLYKKQKEQSELSTSESNLHGQGIISKVKSQRPRKLIHGSEEKIRSSNSIKSDPLQNATDALIKKTLPKEPEKLCPVSGKNIANLTSETSHATEPVACTNGAFSSRLKEMENTVVSGDNNSEVDQGQQMKACGSATAFKEKRVLYNPQVVDYPGIGRCEREVNNEAHSELSMMLTAGKPHECQKTLDKVHSKTDTSSDDCTKEPYSNRIDSNVSHNSNISGNNLSSHSSQNRVRESSCDTFCGPDIQKHPTTTSKDNSSVNSNSIKADANISRTVSKMESKKNAEKCIQGLHVTRKPNHVGIDASMLQQLVNEWNSDTERVRSFELSQSDKPSYKDMKSQDKEVITNPSADKVEQVLKDWDAREVDDDHEDILLGEAAVTNGNNQKLSSNVEAHKHPVSPLLSHTISVNLQNVGDDTPTSKNADLKVIKNSKSKHAFNLGSIQKLGAPRDIKSNKLENSNPNTGNFNCTEGLDQVSRNQEKSIHSTETPSRKRRLYSISNSPEVIELENFDDISLFPSAVSKRPSRGRRRDKKSNVSEPLTKKPQGGGKRQRRKKEAISTCSEREQMGVTVSSVGELSQETELGTSVQFSVKSFSGRWRNKYLEDVTKRKLQNKCKKKMEHPVYNSVYSDIESDSDSVISWFENTKQKSLHCVQKPKITYEKKRSLFPNKQKMKQILCPRQLTGQPPLPRIKKKSARPKIERSLLSKPTISRGKKTSKDISDETFVTRVVENRLPDIDLFRSNENEQSEELVPVEINILPCLDGAATSDSRTVPSYIEAEHSTGSKITPVKEKELLNDKKGKSMNIKNADKTTGKKKDCGFNLDSASGGIGAKNSQITVPSAYLSKLTCMKKFVDQDVIRQEYGSSGKEEFPVCFYGPLLGAQKRDAIDNENMCTSRASSELPDKIAEMHSNHKGTRYNQNVPSAFHSESNEHLNFTSQQNDEIESPLPAAEVGISPKSSQNNTGSCSDAFVVGCEDDFEEFCKRFSESVEKETNLHGNLEYNNMTVMKDMSEGQKRGRKKICGKKASRLANNASFLLGEIGNYDIKDYEKEDGSVNVLYPAIRLEQPTVPSLPSFCTEDANSSDNGLSLSPFNPLSASSFSKEDGQSLSPMTDLLLSKKAEEPVSLNIERCLDSQGHMNYFSFPKRDGLSVSPNIGLSYSERFQKPVGQVNDTLFSKRNEQAVSPVRSFSYSKRVRKSPSPCGTKVVPVSPIRIPSLPTEAEAVNIPVSALSLSKKMAQSNGEVSQEDTVPLQQKNILLSLESGTEDLNKVGVQSFNFLQSAHGVPKNKKKNKENIRCTTVTKQREKYKKTNNNMDLATEGTSAHDGRTVTMRGITEVGGK